MIYLACFAGSALFAHYANKTQKKQLFWLFSVLSILVTVLLAGLRDYSIGIDVKNYLNMDRFWAGAIRAESLGDYMKHYLSLGLREPLFALFIGAIAQFTGQYRVFLFLSHVIIMVGVYIGAYRMRHRVRPELVLFLFYVLYFNNSLNIIRQYMALAIIFAFFADLEQRKFVRYLVVVLVCSLIHTTALLSLPCLAVYLLLYPRKEISTVKTRYLLGLSILVAVGLICFVPVIKLLMQTGILSKKYQFFFNDGFTRMSYTRLALLIMETAAVIFCYKKFRCDVPRGEYYLVHTVIFMSMQLLAQFFVDGHRLVLYFAMPNIITLLTLPKTLDSRKLRLPGYGVITLDSKKLRLLGYGAILVFSLYYWYYQYVGAQSSGTYPYVFGF